MKKPIEMILIDVDDCLLPTDGEVPFKFFYALWDISQLIKEANEGMFPQIGFCSGRDRNYIEAVSFFMGLPDSWSVIESGIALFNPTTKELLLSPALIPEVREAFEEISRRRIPKILKEYPDLYLYPGNMIQVTLERKHESKTPLVECYNAVIEELADLISSGLVTIHHSQIAIDIGPAGIDKGSGVKFLAEKTGVQFDQMLGIGDSRGDFPMLEIVGHIGCPANASEECKKLVGQKGEYSGYISSLSYARGVLDVIRCHAAIAPPSY